MHIYVCMLLSDSYLYISVGRWWQLRYQGEQYQNGGSGVGRGEFGPMLSSSLRLGN